MNLTRSSKAVVLGVLLAVALTAVGTVGAVDFADDEAPSEGEVGEEASFTVTMEDAFDEQPNSWTVVAETGLENATVRVQAETTSAPISSTGDQSTTLEIDASELRGDSVTIEVTGTVPGISNYSYEDREQENVTALAVSEQNGATLGTWQAHRFTENSKDAREAIDNASSAVEDSDNEDAEERLDEAITFYNDGNFQEAITAANDAQDTAEGSDGGGSILLIAGAALVLVVLVAGGVYFWQSQQQDTNKLR